MKTIIVATDFTNIATNATNYAIDFCNALGYNLTLMHVVPFIIPTSEAPSPISSQQSLYENASIKLSKITEALVAKNNHRIAIQYKICEGNFIEELLTYCETINPYVVIIGTESKTGLDRILFGNKTMQAVKQLQWPVIIVPESIQFNGLKKIGIACDFKNVATTIPIDEINEMVHQCNAQLYVIHVSELNAETYDSTTIEASGWLHDMLFHLHPKYHFLKGDNTETELINFATQYQLDLLIVIPKKHHFIQKILTQSLSKKIILQTHTPVMAIHKY